LIISRFMTALEPAVFPVRMRRHAILAALIVLAAPPAGVAGPQADDRPPPAETKPAEETPPPGRPARPFTPIPVRFRLADGSRVAGELTGWDREGIDGSFGRRAWAELHHEDVRRLYRRLMDGESAADWVDLGRAMLLVALDQPQAERWAERSFQRALTMSEDTRAAIAAAREEVAERRQMRAEAKAAAQAQRLATGSPEAAAWPPDPWPELTKEQLSAARLEMQSDAEQILEKAGLQLAPIETDHLLFYSDMAGGEAAAWAARLEEACAMLARRLDLPDQSNIFWGKAVVFALGDRDRFRLLEAESFQQLVAQSTYGLCHPVGPKVFISCHRTADADLFGAVLVRELVHGFMHRYRTPFRLPLWANEGLADYYASVLFRNSPLDLERRRAAVGFIRGGGNIDGVLSMSYEDEISPREKMLDHAVGALVIEVMIREQPARFARWVDAVKDGKDWQKALAEDFGIPRRALVQTAGRYYMMND